MHRRRCWEAHVATVHADGMRRAEKDRWKLRPPGCFSDWPGAAICQSSRRHDITATQPASLVWRCCLQLTRTAKYPATVDFCSVLSWATHPSGRSVRRVLTCRDHAHTFKIKLTHVGFWGRVKMGLASRIVSYLLSHVFAYMPGRRASQTAKKTKMPLKRRRYWRCRLDAELDGLMVT